MNDIVVDESRLPILVIRWFGNPSREQFEAYLARTTEFITARELRARVTLHDTSHGLRSQATFRIETAEWMRRYEAEIKRAALGIGFVMDNGMMRGMLTAIFWMRPLPVPYENFPTLDAGIEWANGLLRSAGIVPKPGSPRYLR